MKPMEPLGLCKMSLTATRGYLGDMAKFFVGAGSERVGGVEIVARNRKGIGRV